MTTRRPHSHDDPKRESLYQLIAQALSDMQNPELPPDSEMHDHNSTLESKREAFFAAIQSPWLNQPTTLSLIEQWASNASNLNWYEQINTLIDKMGPQTSLALKSEWVNLQSSLESLSKRLVPAPAHRGPAAARMVYPSQRRNIPAADLPTFHPLFCTSVDTSEGPVRLTSLSMNSSYSCKFHSVTDSSWMYTTRITAGPSGGFRLDLSNTLSNAPDGAVVWLIEEDAQDDPDSAWISGLIWRSEPISPSDHDEYVDAKSIDWPWRRIKTLTEINRLYSCGMYVEAYETARCALRTERAAPNDGSVVPFSEALWLMIEKCLDSMIAQLEAAQPVFQTMKSDWDAIQPLRRIRKDISL